MNITGAGFGEIDQDQPFKSQRHNAGSLANGTAALTPPAAWGGGPVALQIGAPPVNRRSP